MIEIETRCEFVDLKQPWTVGDPQKLVCRWERDTEFTGSFFIKFPNEENTYALVLIEAAASPRELQAIVTGYKPAKYEEMIFSIVSGDKTLKVAPLNWQIESVIKQEEQQQQQQPPQPVPSYGPFMLPFPAWILWTAAVLLIAIVVASVYTVIRRRQKKAFQKKLDGYLHQGSPHNQVHTALRALIRLMDSAQKSKSEALQELDTLLRQYLMGTFSIPTENLSAQKLIKALSSRSERWSKDLKIQFRQFVFDLERLKEQGTELNQEDLLDLCLRLRKLIDLIQFQRGRP